MVPGGNPDETCRGITGEDSGDHGTAEERGTGEHRVQKDESVPVNSRTDAESSASGEVPDKEEVSVFESQPKGARPP